MGLAVTQSITVLAVSLSTYIVTLFGHAHWLCTLSVVAKSTTTTQQQHRILFFPKMQSPLFGSEALAHTHTLKAYGGALSLSLSLI